MYSLPTSSWSDRFHLICAAALEQRGALWVAVWPRRRTFRYEISRVLFSLDIGAQYPQELPAPRCLLGRRGWAGIAGLREHSHNSCLFPECHLFAFSPGFGISDDLESLCMNMSNMAICSSWEAVSVNKTIKTAEHTEVKLT